jgi:hypothetical protein
MYFLNVPNQDERHPETERVERESWDGKKERKERKSQKGRPRSECMFVQKKRKGPPTSTAILTCQEVREGRPSTVSLSNLIMIIHELLQRERERERERQSRERETK